MNLIELQRALRQLRLGGTAAVLETRLRQAQTEAMAPIDLISCLVSDELTRRSERLLDRRRKQAAFRDPHKTLDNFDFTFNPKMNRSLVFDLATCAFVKECADTCAKQPIGESDLCSTYCDCMETVCSDHPFEAGTCTDICNKFDPNQLVCRPYHCNLAKTNMANPDLRALHCGHASGNPPCH